MGTKVAVTLEELKGEQEAVIVHQGRRQDHILMLRYYCFVERSPTEVAQRILNKEGF